MSRVITYFTILLNLIINVIFMVLILVRYDLKFLCWKCIKEPNINKTEILIIFKHDVVTMKESHLITELCLKLTDLTTVLFSKLFRVININILFSLSVTGVIFFFKFPVFYKYYQALQCYQVIAVLKCDLVTKLWFYQVYISFTRNLFIFFSFNLATAKAKSFSYNIQ